MRTLFYLPLLLLLTAILNEETVAQKRTTLPQTEFGMETPIKKPMPVPQKIVTAFDIDRSLLTASLIDLNNDKQPELLVQSSAGANVTEFRIYRKVRGSWRQVLATIAHSVWVDKKPNRGFRNINIAAASAVTVWQSTYKFNGAKYLPAVCTEQRSGKDKKPRNIPCGAAEKPYR